MKRTIVLIAVFCLMTMFATEALSDGAATEMFVVYANKAPVIDGAMSEDEWEGAIAYTLDELTAAECDGEPGSDAVMVFYLMWDQEGLYMYSTVEDATMAPPVKPGYPLNETDAVQLGINPTNKKGNEINDAYFFSFVPETDENYSSAWFEHFVYGGSPEGTGVQAAGKREGESYTLEIFLPWSSLKHKNEDFAPYEGMKMGSGVTVVDFDEKGKNLAIYKSWPGWEIGDYNGMVLCPKDWEVPAEYGKEQRSFAIKEDVDTQQNEGASDSAVEEEQGISLIVFVFAAILLGTVLIAVNKWKERSNEE